MSKRGQVTVFVILGLILAIGFGFVFYLKNNPDKNGEIEKVSILPFDAVPIRNYVDACIQNVGKSGISIIGPRGGYIDLPKYSTRDFLTKTAYYFYLDRDVMPSKQQIEHELSEYMNQELFFCIRNFVDFKDKGYEIEQGKIDAQVKISPNNVLFKINFPILIKKGASETRLDSFSKSAESTRLGTIYNASRSIINEQMKDFTSICLSCIINFGIENDLHIDLQRIGNDTILFTITDFNTTIDGFPYKYIFANRYREISCQNIPVEWPEERINDFLLNCAKLKIESLNYRLKINEIPNLIATANFPFAYDVNASGFNVNFFDFTDLFDINKTTGLINFTPIEYDIGEHVIWIEANDSLGNRDYGSFNLKIKKP